MRISRRSNMLLAIAFAGVAFASLGIVWITHFVPGAPGSRRVPESGPIAVRSGFPPCLSCGTVLVIRTFELRDETAPEPAGATRLFVYRVTLQMDDGSYRTFSQNVQPPFGVGTRVRVLNGAIAART